MNKYINFLISFVSSKLASLIFLYILYNYHEEVTWKNYSLYLVNIVFFKNITLGFTSNLGHEGLLSKSKKSYNKLFSTILFIVLSLQAIGFIIYFNIGENKIFIYSYLFAVISFLQGLIQNYQRFSLNYNDYSKSTLLFSLGNLIIVFIFLFNSLEVYLASLILISFLFFLNYFEVLRKIISSFDLRYIKENIKKLSVSSFKLYFINTFPDSIFILYVPLLFSDILSEVNYAALVFLISLIGIKIYPILTLVIQKYMDYIKKFHSKNNVILNNIVRFNNKESNLVLLIITAFILFEIIYISFFTKPLIITFQYFGFIFWILPLVFLRHFINSIIEVKKDLKYKVFPFFVTSFLLFLIYFFDKVTILNIIIICWISLLHLTLKHILENYLNFILFFKFYKNYFIVGTLFHLNYYLIFNSNQLLNTGYYLLSATLIFVILTITFRKLIYDNFKKINQLI